MRALFQDKAWKEILYNLSENKRGFLGMNGMKFKELFLATPCLSQAQPPRREGLSFISNHNKKCNLLSNE